VLNTRVFLMGYYCLAAGTSCNSCKNSYRWRFTDIHIVEVVPYYVLPAAPVARTTIVAVKPNPPMDVIAAKNRAAQRCPLRRLQSVLLRGAGEVSQEELFSTIRFIITSRNKKE